MFHGNKRYKSITMNFPFTHSFIHKTQETVNKTSKEVYNQGRFNLPLFNFVTNNSVMKFYLIDHKNYSMMNQNKNPPFGHLSKHNQPQFKIYFA